MASQESNVYSLCCLILEVCMEVVPWGDRGAMEIVTMFSRGCSLRLDREKLPRLLYRLMKEGFVWALEQRDLDLEEVRDMLILTRGELEKEIRRFQLQILMCSLPQLCRLMSEDILAILPSLSTQQTKTMTLNTLNLQTLTMPVFQLSWKLLPTMLTITGTLIILSTSQVQGWP